MSTPIRCAPAHAAACLIPAVRQLDRFRPDLKPYVGALARRHVRLAELCRSFPALLAALARPRCGYDPEPAIDAVIAGAPLAELSRMSAVPLWLRRLSPAMVIAPLPLLPDSAFISQRIVNHFPRYPHQAPRWFETVSEAGRWVHEDFALWCAQNISEARWNPRIRPRRRRRVLPLRLLSLWAWYSGQTGTRAHRLIEIAWNPEMQLKAAMEAASDWRETLWLEMNLAGHAVEDTWHRPGSARGYDFVPLRTVEDVRGEARVMRNCLRDYGESVAQDFSRLWSVRSNGENIATLEVGRPGQSPIPTIRQLCLKENGDPPPEVWLAAHDWLSTQPVHIFSSPPRAWEDLQPDHRVWRDLWKPYWLAHKQIPAWLPLSPNRHTLFDL